MNLRTCDPQNPKRECRDEECPHFNTHHYEGSACDSGCHRGNGAKNNVGCRQATIEEAVLYRLTHNDT
jgi:hypothetical protein